MPKVTVSRMRERYAQTVLTFRITYVLIQACACGLIYLYGSLPVGFITEQTTLIQELYRISVVCSIINTTKWLPQRLLIPVNITP